MTDQQSDNQLLQRFADDGDESALATVIERHAGLVLGVCRRITNDAADDAAQAVFLLLAHKARKLAQHAHLSGWLHRTAIYVAGYQRKNAEARRAREQEVGRIMLNASRSADSASDDRLEGSLDAAIATLPAAYRRPIIMHYLDGLDGNTVAERLALSPAALAMRLSRGRELLRNRLGQRAVSGAVLLSLLSDNGNAGEVSVFAAQTTGIAKARATKAHTAASALLATRMLQLERNKIRWLVGAAAATLVISVLVFTQSATVSPTSLDIFVANGLPDIVTANEDESGIANDEEDPQLEVFPLSRISISPIGGFTLWADHAGHHLARYPQERDAVLSTLFSIDSLDGELENVLNALSGMRKVPIFLESRDHRVLQIHSAAMEGREIPPAVMAHALSAEQITLAEVLDRLCDDTGCTWTTTEEAIVLHAAPLIPITRN
jgi:RNA polymerase sigma factor (sigma-70 family)